MSRQVSFSRRHIISTCSNIMLSFILSIPGNPKLPSGSNQYGDALASLLRDLRKMEDTGKDLNPKDEFDEAMDPDPTEETALEDRSVWYPPGWFAFILYGPLARNRDEGRVLSLFTTHEGVENNAEAANGPPQLSRSASRSAKSKKRKGSPSAEDNNLPSKAIVQCTQLELSATDIGLKTKLYHQRDRDGRMMALKARGEVLMNSMAMFRQMHDMANLTPEDRLEMQSIYNKYKAIDKKIEALFEQPLEVNNEPALGEYTMATLQMFKHNNRSSAASSVAPTVPSTVPATPVNTGNVADSGASPESTLTT